MEEKQLVFIDKDRAVTDSLMVAEVFGKEHKHVMRDIREILATIDVEWGMSNFGLTPYMHPQNGQTYQKYVMTEDGFTILAMGYTGRDAMQFKVNYIREFRRMQAELEQQTHAGTYTLPTNYKEALLALIAEVEKTERLEAEKLLLEQRVAEYEPKATYVDQILESKSTVAATQIAKDYGLTAQRLNLILHEEHVQFKVNNQWVLYKEHQSQGYTKSRTFEYADLLGEQMVTMHTEWTQKGRLFIHGILSKRGIIPCMDRENHEVNNEPINLVLFPSNWID